MSFYEDAAREGYPVVAVMNRADDEQAMDRLAQDLRNWGAFVVTTRDATTGARGRQFDLILILTRDPPHALDDLEVDEYAWPRLVVVALDPSAGSPRLSAGTYIVEGRERQVYLWTGRADGVGTIASDMFQSGPFDVSYMWHSVVDPRRLALMDPEPQRTVEDVLTRLGASWLTEAAVGGVRPDYLAELPDNRSVVVELKRSGNPSVLDIAMAEVDAQRIAAAAGADMGVAVFAGPQISVSTPGAVGYRDFEDAIGRSVARERTEARPEVMNQARSVFVAMPFAATYEDTYFGAVRGAAEDAGAACRRLDREEYAGDIITKLRELIVSADVVIADLSGANANVLYEVGYAHALALPTIHVCATPLSELPFDVRNWATIPYELGRTHLLREPLARRLKAVLDEERRPQ